MDEKEEITATELKAKFDRGDHFTLIDVREPYEYAIGNIPGAILVPLATVAERAYSPRRSSQVAGLARNDGRCEGN